MHPETASTTESVAEQKRALLKRKLTKAAMVEFPLSHGQKALWFLHTMTPDPAQLQDWVDEIIPSVTFPPTAGPTRRMAPALR